MAVQPPGPEQRWIAAEEQLVVHFAQRLHELCKGLGDALISLVAPGLEVGSFLLRPERIRIDRRGDRRGEERAAPGQLEETGAREGAVLHFAGQAHDVRRWEALVRQLHRHGVVVQGLLQTQRRVAQDLRLAQQAEIRTLEQMHHEHGAGRVPVTLPPEQRLHLLSKPLHHVQRRVVPVQLRILRVQPHQALVQRVEAVEIVHAERGAIFPLLHVHEEAVDLLHVGHKTAPREPRRIFRSAGLGFQLRDRYGGQLAPHPLEHRVAPLPQHALRRFGERLFVLRSFRATASRAAGLHRLLRGVADVVVWGAVAQLGERVVQTREAQQHAGAGVSPEAGEREI
eukprot:scaffold7381_cov310-Pinguiococcus_pyrenoidosus.AAC.68